MEQAISAGAGRAAQSSRPRGCATCYPARSAMNTTTRMVVRSLGVILAAGLLLSGCERRHRAAAPAAPPHLNVRHEIERLLDRTEALPLADTTGAGRVWQRTEAAYRERHHHPLWSERNALRPQAIELVHAIADAGRFGLDPSDYGLRGLQRLYANALRRDSSTAWLEPRVLARFDVAASVALLRLGEDLRHGRVEGDTLDADWRRRPDEEFWPAWLERAARESPDSLLASLEPRSARYRALETALARYRAVAAHGGWLEIPPGPPLTAGARGLRVARLIRRLAATGELRGPVRDTVMDVALVQAVGDFQTRNGIPRSGTVGDATRAVLNVPVADRIRTIGLNLERWRWLPDSLGARRVEVNIPAFRVELFRADTVTRAMRVVVGKRTNPTPVFTTRLTYLELNPTWTLPPSVVFKEIIPAMHGKPAPYLARNHMFVTRLARGDTLDPALVEWKQVRVDSFPYLVVQRAGPDNPLGQIKLMCPNEYDVYLHDTPRRDRFVDAVRDYSHGCVRLSGAVELADSLLELAPADSARLTALIATGRWGRIHLPHAVPVHFLYWTAWADSGGAVHWRDDLYGVDDRLAHALRDHGGPPFALNPNVGISQFWMADQQRRAAEQEKKKKKAKPSG